MNPYKTTINNYFEVCIVMLLLCVIYESIGSLVDVVDFFSFNNRLIKH